MDLTTATPVEIDTVLAGLYSKWAALTGDFPMVRGAIFSAVDLTDEDAKPSRYERSPRAAFKDAEAKCRENGLRPGGAREASLLRGRLARAAARVGTTVHTSYDSGEFTVEVRPR